MPFRPPLLISTLCINAIAHRWRDLSQRPTPCQCSFFYPFFCDESFLSASYLLVLSPACKERKSERRQQRRWRGHRGCAKVKNDPLTSVLTVRREDWGQSGPNSGVPSSGSCSLRCGTKPLAYTVGGRTWWFSIVCLSGHPPPYTLRMILSIYDQFLSISNNQHSSSWE